MCIEFIIRVKANSLCENIQGYSNNKSTGRPLLVDLFVYTLLHMCYYIEKSGGNMRPYIAWYKGKRIELEANSSYEAQTKAAKAFKAKKAFDVNVMLADVEVNCAQV